MFVLKSFVGLVATALTLLITCRVLHYLSWYTRYRQFQHSHGCQFLQRSPQKDPILGLDCFLRLTRAAKDRRYLDEFQQWFRQVGTTFGVNLMGDYVIFTNEPKNIQAILVNKFADFEIGQRRRDNSADLLGVGVFNADGRDWEHGRALVRPNFTRQRVTDTDLFEKHVQNLLACLPNDGSAIDMQEYAFRFTLDTGTDMLFGESSNVLSPGAADIARRFAWAFDKGVSGIAQRIRLGKFARFHVDREYSAACRFAHGYVDVIVARAIGNAREWHSKTSGGLNGEDASGRHEPYTFLNALAREGVDAKQMRDQVLNILVAARDTSACLMSSAIFELARRPEYQKRLRFEATDCLQGQRPTVEKLRDLTLLNQFVKETLRLYLPVPLNARVAKQDTVLPSGGGLDGSYPIFIPKGQLVVYQVYSMHRREDLWGPEANKFDPERWEKARPMFEYLPFNAGPRICPGQQFAIMETTYFLLRLLQEYSKIEACEIDKPWTEDLTLTCSVGQGVWVKLFK